MKKILVDCHNDTAYRMYFEKENLFSNNLHIDIKKQQGFKTLLFYAIFMDPDYTSKMGVDTYFYSLYNNFINELNINKDYLSIVNDIDTFLNNDKQGAILALEGGCFIDSLEKVDVLKELNIKAVTLTWNDTNKIATSQMSGDKGGLSQFGYSVVDRLTQKGILVDLSHISDEAFYDVVDYLKTPVLVSHSNAISLCDFPRNITDDMFLRVVKNGGVVGINFCCDFLGKNPNIGTIVNHIEHFLGMGGESNIAFGSDFDGIPTLPKGIRDFSSYEKIIDEMLKRNINFEIIEKITSGNMINLLKTIDKI
jgi:membrane dipeptidase